MEIENLDELIKGNVDLVLQSEVHEGTLLRQKLDGLLANFEGLDSESYDRNEWQDLYNEMLEFEKTVSHFEILNFFYGFMARVALNSRLFKEAYSLAKAGLSLNEIGGDQDGVKSNHVILCDIAAATFNIDDAIKYYCLADPSATLNNSEILAALMNMKMQGAGNPIPYQTDKKPKSFKYCYSDEGKKEKAIRIIMKQLNITRDSAKKYIITR